MSTLVFSMVLGSAFLHALWNSLLKSGADKQAIMTAIVMWHVPCAIVGMSFAPMPDLASVPYILIGAVFHVAYQIFLLNAYKFGDLSQVYPVARGVAPMIVAVVSIAVLGVALRGIDIMAIVLITTGLMSLALLRKDTGARNPKAVALALATGAMIASYSLVDGMGARVAGTSLGYYGWLTILNAVFMLIYTARAPKAAQVALRGVMLKPVAIVGGAASYLAYSVVTWAFTQAPIALVTALRETSIIFALLLGVFVLNEKMSAAKVMASLLTIAGAIVLHLS